ncbi:phosphate regulon sensor histidine kinase PhoR [Alkalimonas amylolytica]|uniref:Phosphate regulon sensor protein PhoR n=1 Tax=Alkalimonas amylolytica TaxID=152573 RepID=A0A1H4E1I2_ALKAM|nr:phosphate regulon sensor histidine kinase PhoR [Alkalimonas amylolytica]SEA78885.1 two-component system, OmpR family, phosphate regulon sensor histidine kinase PhoR [Alkalimonas amylolytica]
MRLLLSKRAILFRLACLFSFAALLGSIWGRATEGMLLAALMLLLWHYKHLFMMDRWLWRDRKLTPPDGWWSWQQIFDGVYYQQRKSRRKQKELQERIRRFRDGAEALPEAIVVLSDEWSIVWCNKLAQLLIGLRWPQDEGQRIDNLVRHPEFQKYLHRQDFKEALVLTAHHPEELVLEFRFVPYGEHQFLLIVRDITQLKQLEQIRKDFVANVSHELRTPLTVVQGYLEMLEPGQLPDEAMWQKIHPVMLDQTLRMQALVQQLLALSRIEASGPVQHDRIVQVPGLLHYLEQEAQSLNRDKNHQISFLIDEQLLVKGSEDELRSAFSNLISNAIKYTQPGGEIKVSWQRQHTKAVFSVNDNGEGIAPKHVKRLTERFYRVDQARSRATGGSGLGLAIVKHVLSRHNSRLLIFSEPGAGSSFSFSLAAENALSPDQAAGKLQ